MVRIIKAVLVYNTFHKTNYNVCTYMQTLFYKSFTVLKCIILRLNKDLWKVTQLYILIKMILKLQNVYEKSEKWALHSMEIVLRLKKIYEK